MSVERFRPHRQTPGRLAVRLTAICDPPPLTVICIGTDRSTGDSLGPLTGSLLRAGGSTDLRVFGSVGRPIHAANLREFAQTFESAGSVVAVDACLGKRQHVGTVGLCRQPLRPGAGVHKNLPEIGDMHITGTVGKEGSMGFAALQSARLSMILSLAGWIAASIEMAGRMSAALQPGDMMTGTRTGN